MNWRFWKKKPKSDSITHVDNLNRNINLTNTQITTSAGEGCITYLHVDSHDPAVAEAIYNRIYEKLKSDVKKQRGFE
jgi:hypothetical protein